MCRSRAGHWPIVGNGQECDSDKIKVASVYEERLFTILIWWGARPEPCNDHAG
jgi:hypothetical protein